MQGAMLLDPYHRIRATVAVLFALCVVVMALVSPHGRRPVGPSSPAAVAPAVVAPAVVSSGVVVRRARVAGAKRHP